MHKINKLQIAASIILLLGIVALVYLSKQTQILKSKAGDEIYNFFEVTDSDGNILNQITGLGTQRIYQTDDLNVNIRIKEDFLRTLDTR